MQRIVTLTPAQSDTWILGGAAAQAVEAEVAALLQDYSSLTILTVLLDTGAEAFTLMQWGRP